MNNLTLVVKYRENSEYNFIEKHKEILNKNNYCWFGKIGKNTAPLAISVISKKLPATLILYSKESVYRCVMDQISYDKPKEFFPEYYKDLWKEDENIMSVFFRVTKIEKINSSELNNYVVESNSNNLYNSLKSCSKTCMLAKKI